MMSHASCPPAESGAMHKRTFMITRKCFYRGGLAIALALLLSACASVPRSESVNTLDQLLNDPVLEGSLVSLTVRDADTGTSLYQRNGMTRLLPASGLKLLTTAAAMEVLGAEFGFSTQVLTAGQLKGDRLDGDLYLRGSGDPSIQAEDYQRLAADLAALGIKRVRGNVLIDDTAFDSVRLGVDWANDDESAAYAAQISALSLSPDSDFDAGTVIVTARATVEGDPVVVNIHPANTIMTVTNSVTIGAANTLRVSREHGSNRLLVSGTLPAGTAARKWVSVWEPTRLVADVFHRALIAQGIKVDGRTVIGVTTPSGARPLAAHDSLPLAQLLTPLLKLSNNNMTEVLLKTMGRSTGNVGTAESGIAVVNSFLQRHGLQGSAIVQVDGSGLSRRNLISTQSLTDLLLRVRHQPWFDYWYAALPIAGNPERMLGGTLRNRLRGTFAQDNLHAKTGTMTAVSSLSGYLRSVEGRALVFAMISNNYLAEGAAVKSLEDKVAVALTQWSD